MAEEKPEEEEWLGCPNSVKNALPGKIKNAVKYALDECFLEMVGTPEAQRNKWIYQEIKKKICAAMKGWIEEEMEEAIKKAVEK